MEFQDVVRKRRMVRSFERRALPREVVERILANAQRAPSAGFSQGWAFLVLEGDAETRRYWDAVGPDDRAGFQWQDLFNAPLLIVCLSNKSAYLDRYAEPDKGWTDRSEAHWPAPYWDIDTGMAAMLILLTAVDAGSARCSSASRRRRSTRCARPSASRQACSPSAPSRSATRCALTARRHRSSAATGRQPKSFIADTGQRQAEPRAAFAPRAICRFASGGASQRSGRTRCWRAKTITFALRNSHVRSTRG